MTPFNPRLSHAYRELAHAATETAKTAWRRPFGRDLAGHLRPASPVRGGGPMKPFEPVRPSTLLALRDALRNLEQDTRQLVLAQETNNLDSTAIKHLRRLRRKWREAAVATRASIDTALAAEEATAA